MEFSLLSWNGGEFTSSCGYCHKRGFVSTGMTSLCMTAHDYQNLVDRGWRRCGTYLYKPNNKKTCCPLYTIRCDAVNLQLSKSQKKVLRRFNAFLMGNDDGKNLERRLPNADNNEGGGINEIVLPQSTTTPTLSKQEIKYIRGLPSTDTVDSKSQERKNAEPCVNNDHVMMKEENSKETISMSNDEEAKPKRKKAKLLRLERRKAKIEKRGNSEQVIETKQANKEKSLEDYLNEVSQEKSARKLEITLVRSVSTKETHDECFKLYKKYQEVIHNDSVNSFDDYADFLMDSSLNEITYNSDFESPPCGYGTFHQMYRIDGKLIAVGVLDILPRCVSSVYFFYDPDYMHLSLGTYGALRELELTRKLAKKCPSLDQYYLGYYIHSCQKMRYKGQWKPSYLLCPEAYTWHSISECLRKLEVSPYSRLNEDVDARSEEDNVDVGAVKLFRSSTQPSTYVRDCKDINEFWKSVVSEFAHLVGRTAAQKMHLFYDQSASPESEELDEWV